MYPEDLARRVHDALAGAGFSLDLRVVPVTTAVDVAALAEVGLGTEYRWTVDGDEGRAPLASGLAFDAGRVRTQAVTVADAASGSAQMVISLAVAPEWWVSRRRFFTREGDGVRVGDFRDVAGASPRFLVSPSWTQVVPAHRYRYTRAMVRAHVRALAVLAGGAPPGTWLELGAQGTWPWDQRDRLVPFASRPVGTQVPSTDLPFPLSAVGMPREESRFTRTCGRFAGWREVLGVGDAETLGALFVQDLPWEPPRV